jgi:hypothetical protein
MITSMTVVKSGLGNQVLQIKKGFKNSMITPQYARDKKPTLKLMARF